MKTSGWAQATRRIGWSLALAAMLVVVLGGATRPAAIPPMIGAAIAADHPAVSRSNAPAGHSARHILARAAPSPGTEGPLRPAATADRCCRIVGPCVAILPPPPLAPVIGLRAERPVHLAGAPGPRSRAYSHFRPPRLQAAS